MTRNEIEKLVRQGKWVFPGEGHVREAAQQAHEKRQWTREERIQKIALYAFMAGWFFLIGFLCHR